MCKISIITASYNYQDYIKETIESVINQTFQDWEMVIVDDGSKDNSVAVIKEYCDRDSRIKLYTHPNNENRGLAETVKLGMEKAQSEWIVFLESDDTITPNYIEEKLKVVNEYPDIKFIYNDVNMFGDETRIKKMQRYFKKTYQILNNTKFPANLLKYFYKFNIVPTFSCVMLKKDVMQGLDWNARDKRCLDYYLWAQVALKNDFYYINKKLTNWRMSKESYINNKYPELEAIYFNKIQIPSVIYGEIKLIHKINYIRAVIKMLRRKIIQIRINKFETKIKIFNITLFQKHKGVI